MTPTSDIAAKTPAWVCAPGVLKVPFLDVFLNDYDLSAVIVQTLRQPSAGQCQSHAGWHVSQ